MYCNKCGNEIPEGSKFCGSCGTAVQVKKETPVKKQRKEKKQTPVWVSLIVIAAVFLLGKFVIAPSMMSDSEPSKGSYQQEETNAPNVSNAIANETYTEIFNSRYIVEMGAMFRGLDSAVKENLAACTSVDFCSVAYNMGNLYYTVELHFTDLDSSENLQKMYEFGLISESGANYISMQQTEANLIADGYVKK